MQHLSELIRQYKAAPSEQLKDEILNYLIMLEESGRLIVSGDEAMLEINDWVEFKDNIKLKKKEAGIYAAAEMYPFPDGSYMCYYYEIILKNYTNSQLEEYKNNCRELSEDTPDGEFFSALAVAVSHNPDESDNVFMAPNQTAAQLWFGKF